MMEPDIEIALPVEDAWGSEVNDSTTAGWLKVLLWYALGGLFIALIRLGMVLGVSELRSDLAIGSVAVQIAVNVLCIAYLACAKRCTTSTLYIWGISLAVATMLMDVSDAARHHHRSWLSILHLLYISERFNVPKIVVVSITFMVFVHLTLVRLEEASHFGLFHLADAGATTHGDEDDLQGDNRGAKMVFGLCEDLFFVATYAALVHASRIAEEEPYCAVVLDDLPAVINDVTDALHSFDLAEARARLMDASEVVPGTVHVALDNLVGSLEQFQSFIPRSILATSTSFDMSVMSGAGPPFAEDDPIPGVSTYKSTIVFTDIVGSTAAWEACPNAMRECMHIHNTVVRRCLRRVNGYEVKTVGDAFMIAFAEPREGCNFGLTVQVNLAEAAWCEEILRLPQSRYDADGGWRGLRVRVGVEEGNVLLEHNAVTGRCDYHGLTVNRASRLCDKCIGGAVAMSSDMFDRVRHIIDPHISIDASEKSMTLIVPEALAARRKVIEELIRVPQPPQRGRSMSASLSTQPPRPIVWKVGSIGRVDLRVDPADADVMCNEGVCRIQGCAERSIGTLVSVVGCSVTVAWNAARQCPSHEEASFRFASLCHSQLDGMDGLLGSYMGLCSGRIAHGIVGASPHFANVVGSAVNLSGYLVTAAIDCEIECLYATLVSREASLAVQRYVRPVEVWNTSGPRRESLPSRGKPDENYEATRIIVYELVVAMLKGLHMLLSDGGSDRPATDFLGVKRLENAALRSISRTAVKL